MVVAVTDGMRTTLVVLAGAGWLFNLIAPAFVPTYEASLAAQAPLMLILGALFATRNRDGG